MCFETLLLLFLDNIIRDGPMHVSCCLTARCYHFEIVRKTHLTHHVEKLELEYNGHNNGDVDGALP